MPEDVLKIHLEINVNVCNFRQTNLKYQILERQFLLKSFPRLSQSSFIFGNERLVAGSNTMAGLLGNQVQALQGNPLVPAIAQGGGIAGASGCQHSISRSLQT